MTDSKRREDMTDDEWELYYAARENRSRHYRGLSVPAPLQTCDRCGKFVLGGQCVVCALKPPVL